MVSAHHARFERPLHTYSIVARDPETGQLGVAVQSHAFAVGAAVTWAEAGVGAVATQSLTRIAYGPEGLALMRVGLSARQTLDALVANDPEQAVRQVAMVDAHGGVATHTGATCIAAAGHVVGESYSVQANLMVDDTVWTAMQTAYEAEVRAQRGDLADRLVVALAAAQQSGGDIRGQQSAALLVVAGERATQPWEGRLFDLRVDDHPRPVEELQRLLSLARAYRYADQGDELLTAGHNAEALEAMRKAQKLAPDVREIAFWSAVALFRAGNEQEALEQFARVFAKEPIWIELVPRLVPLGMLPDDAVALKRITSVLTR